MLVLLIIIVIAFVWPVLSKDADALHSSVACHVIINYYYNLCYWCVMKSYFLLFIQQ